MRETERQREKTRVSDREKAERLRQTDRQTDSQRELNRLRDRQKQTERVRQTK